MSDPHPAITAYYDDYSARFTEQFDDYRVPSESLWELPLWAAHISGMLASIGVSSDFLDMSRVPPTAADCTEYLLDHTRPRDHVFISPLAQNFAIALAVSRALRSNHRITIIGGNMSPLLGPEDADFVHRGQATPETLADIIYGRAGHDLIHLFPKRRAHADWKVDYSLLHGYRGRVPLLRLNASHGCLYACEFCGDAWSRRLVLVPKRVLRDELQQFGVLFPDTKWLYIGDKTFGQSDEAVANLRDVLAEFPGYRLIVQTHVLALSERLMDIMEEIGVAVVEMGFESADEDLMQNARKGNRTLHFYLSRIAALHERGMRIILNVLGGLPKARHQSYDQTISFIRANTEQVWLYNLYNFVPYPLTPYFETLRERIFEWDFSKWREDGPPVFMPYFMSPDASFERFLELVEVAHDALRSRRMDLSRSRAGGERG